MKKSKVVSKKVSAAVKHAAENRRAKIEKIGEQVDRLRKMIAIAIGEVVSGEPSEAVDTLGWALAYVQDIDHTNKWDY